MGGFNRHPKVAELRAQLSQKVVAAMLHAEGEAAPKPGESATDLARRLAADAAGKKDWVRLNEILDAPLHTVGLHNVFLPTDAKSVRSFTTALTLEAGGLSDAAVESYTAALSGGSAYLPAEEIRDRLRPLVRWRWLKRPSVIFIILFGGLLIFLFVRSRMNPDEPSSP